jgi:hypothetical protein
MVILSGTSAISNFKALSNRTIDRYIQSERVAFTSNVEHVVP